MCPQIDSVFLGSSTIATVETARNLGVTMDRFLTMSKHVSNICKAASFALHKIGTLRQFLSQAATEKLVHALIMPRIDFCNSLLYGLSDTQISRLQRIQNSAARLVKRTPVRQPISPILQELHWLPVKQRIKYKILLLTFQCLSGTAPSYLQELIRLYTPARNLRSSSKSILISPSVKTYFYGGRSFQSAAADLWNNLPESVKSVNTTEIFKRVLKTHLFTP